MRMNASINTIDHGLRHILMQPSMHDKALSNLNKQLSRLCLGAEEARALIQYAEHSNQKSLYVVALEHGHFSCAQALHQCGMHDVHSRDNQGLRGHLDVAILCGSAPDIELDEMVYWMVKCTGECVVRHLSNPFIRPTLLNAMVHAEPNVHSQRAMQSTVELLMSNGASLGDAFADATIFKWIKTKHKHKQPKYQGRSLQEWSAIEQALHSKASIEQHVNVNAGHSPASRTRKI